MYKLVHPTDVAVTGDHRLHLRFEDGREGEIDFSEFGWTGVFEPLADPRYFALVEIDSEIRTIAWPNNADIAPETLYHWATEGLNATWDVD
jgi:hypothetical protein